ncbi:MAG: AbrB/MazE/SpoVT family DNA-binding domain-containing protein [Deltaproteobacteria bacterium CG11_big_fil_rev_8_21_14_0_20_45_16]|nr:MAG: AbrB/MazE/SpoVT family DNA-binding domain-containing protein [Deltaproteobacteria bacterium CG11_big_fil_rev_8_21_14_0_20_45_16]
MKSKLIQIGNSKGVRLPKAIIEQYDLKSDIEIELREEGLFLRASRRPRASWGESFKLMAESGDDALLDDRLQNVWDESEWTW